MTRHRPRLQAAQPHGHGGACGAGHSGGLVRQPRHRHPDAGRRPRAGRSGGGVAFRERHPRHGPGAGAAQGESLADQRQHAARQPPRRAAAICTMPTASPWCAAGISTSACSAASRWPRTATWRTGRGRRPRRRRQIGGAMDLAVGAKRVWVVMEHTTKDGQPRLLRRCSYPLTAARCVSRVYTDLAVLDVTPRGFRRWSTWSPACPSANCRRGRKRCCTGADRRSPKRRRRCPSNTTSLSRRRRPHVRPTVSCSAPRTAPLPADHQPEPFAVARRRGPRWGRRNGCRSPAPAGPPARRRPCAASPRPAAGSLSAVRAPVRPRELAGVVGDVAGDEGLLALGGDAHADMAGRVAEASAPAAPPRRAGGRPPPARPGPRRGWAARESAKTARCDSSPASRPRPVLELPPAEEVARLREGRHPAPVHQPRVPADMVHVQMGAEHGVDALHRVAGRRHVGAGSCPAGSFQCGMRRPCLSLPRQVSTRMRRPPGVSMTSAWMLMLSRPFSSAKCGDQPGDLPHRLRRRLRQQEAAAAGHLQLDHLGDGDPADRPAHGADQSATAA